MKLLRTLIRFVMGMAYLGCLLAPILMVQEAGSSQLDDSITAKRGKTAVDEAKAKSENERKPAAIENTEETSFQPSAALQPMAPSLGKDSSAMLVDDLNKRRDQIEAKEKELQTKELELKAREQAMAEELKKIEATRDDIAKIDHIRRKENEDKVTKLVETFQTMSARACSRIMSDLDETLAVATMSKMDTEKLAKVLNVMDPKKSSRLTELLAGVVHARKIASVSKNDADETTSQSAKGGEGK